MSLSNCLFLLSFLSLAWHVAEFALLCSPEKGTLPLPPRTVKKKVKKEGELRIENRIPHPLTHSHVFFFSPLGSSHLKCAASGLSVGRATPFDFVGLSCERNVTG